MKILFAGAGAMGARFGWMLSQSGNEVVFADNWKEHVDAINEQGLKIIVDKKDLGNYKIKATSPKAVEGSFDVIFVFTKAMQLDQMMQDILHVIHPKTRIICLLNGLGNVEVIEKYIPKSQIFLGVTVWSSGLGGPGVVDATGSGAIELQQMDKTDDPFNADMLDTFNRAGLGAVYSDDVLQSVWHKVGLNCVLNSYCTLIDCNIAQFGDYKDSEVLVDYVVDEVVAVGHAEGVNVLKDVIVSKIHAVYDPTKAGLHYPSLYQDMAKHRLTEIDYLNGAIARLGKKHGISTPACDLITHMIHAKESVVGAK